MRHILKRVSLVGVAVLTSACFLTSGSVASAQSGLNLTGTGSQNLDMSQFSNMVSKHNMNMVGAGSSNSQVASSGGKSTVGNTIAGGWGGMGGGSTGSAHNTGTNNASVYVNNDGSDGWMKFLSSMKSSGGSGIALTGPGSYNLVESRIVNTYQRNNLNHLIVYNSNDQQARSGNSSNSFNTLGGGGGGTGSASNSGSNSANVSLNNQGDGGGFWATSGGGVSSGKIWLTGPGSRNVISTSVANTYRSTNNNIVTVDNQNNQTAASGNTSSDFNTVAGGGKGSTGPAENKASSSANINVNNSANSNWSSSNSGGGQSSGGSIGLTGPGSFNQVSTVLENNFESTNTNIVDVRGSNDQLAHSGSSTNDGNTIGGGGGSTGAAKNDGSNSASVSLNN